MSKWKTKLAGFFKKELVKDTIWTTIFSTIGKSFGFLIPFFLAAWFGISSETDAFFFAYGLILLLSGIFGPVVESVVVPFIAEHRAEDEAEVKTFLGTILVFITVGLVLLGSIFIVVLKPALRIVTHFSPESINLIFWIMLETIPLLVFLGATSLFSGALNAYKQFKLPAISPALRAIVALIVIFLFKGRIGIHSISMGYVVGEFFRLMLLLYEVKRKNIFSFNFAMDLHPKQLEFLKTSSYQVLGLMVLSFTPVVDKTMASWLAEGSVSILHYADRLYMIPLNILTKGLMIVLLTHWSNKYYKLGSQELNNDVRKTIKKIAIITLPVMMLFILLNQPIVKFAFGRGAFNKAKLAELGWVWACYLLGLFPYAAGIVYYQAHLALKNTKILMYCGFYRFFLNIILNSILMKILFTRGIALATTFTSIFFLWYLKKNLHNKTRTIS